jgi:hypothetical protein
MRHGMALMLVVLCSAAATAQPSGQSRRVPDKEFTYTVETAVRGATERLGQQLKFYAQDTQVLRLLREADDVLSDTMQPSASIQAALDRVQKAEGLASDVFLKNGLVEARNQLEAARRSPGSADFGRLRTMLLEDCIRPALRICLRNATRLQNETQAWLEVQDLIGAQLQLLSEAAYQSLSATQ